MAMQTVTQEEVRAAVARLSNVQGVLACAKKVLDEELSGNPLWEVSEALSAALNIVASSYLTLNESLIDGVLAAANEKQA